jgi:potassium voltage-gated channel Shab-related subfamily B member 1
MLISLLFIVASLISLPLSTMPQLYECCDKEGNTIDVFYLELASPSKRRFLMGILNAIDLLVIVTYFISLVLDHLSLNVQQFVSVRRIVLVLRVLRILRILKLAKHSVGLQSFGYTLQRSYREFGLMMMFIAIGVMIFSTLVYFAEKDIEYSGFITIPDAFWWAIVTMTTVGYGDMVPHTAFGKVIGAMCSISGVLVIALPIPVIVNNFSLFYQEQTRRQKALENRKACNERIHLQPAAGAGAL